MRQRVWLFAVALTLGWLCGCGGRSVRVQDASGQPLAGVEVWASSDGTAGPRSFTNARGEATVEPPPGEPLWIHALKRNYGSASVPWPQAWPATLTVRNGSADRRQPR